MQKIMPDTMKWRPLLMDGSREFEVTLSPDLYACLSQEAEALGIPLAYLVAGLVLDTVEEVASEPAPLREAG